MVVLVLIYIRLVHATRRLPPGSMYGRSLGVTALLCLVAQTIAGLTVDLRFFDFPNIVVMLMAGTVIGWQRHQARAIARSPAPSVQVPMVPQAPVRRPVYQ